MDDLKKAIEAKRAELNKMMDEEADKDEILKKSRELDELIALWYRKGC